MNNKQWDGTDLTPATPMSNEGKIESLKQIRAAYEAIRELGADENLAYSVDEQIGNLEEWIAIIEALGQVRQ